MPRQKPELVRLHELANGQFADFFALLSEKTRGATREGKPFFTCRFRDAKRAAALMVWVDGPWFELCERAWQVGQIYKLRGAYGESERYGPQLDIQNIRPVIDADRADGFNLGDLVEHSRRDADEMFAALVDLAGKEIADEGLRKLVLTLLERYADPLKRVPATLNKFHPFAAGLLEHTLSVTRSCLLLADKYRADYPDLQPPLNRDLIVSAAMVHDIGRVIEFTSDLLSPQPTIPGRLFGHLFLGRDLIRDTARELGDVNPELVQLLEHLVISHLNLPEWGSPRLPLIPESLILHHADDLDAKLEMYVRCLTRDHAEGAFTDRDPVLNRQLFKGRSV
jgi:3'-5' exoribonuclease